MTYEAMFDEQRTFGIDTEVYGVDPGLITTSFRAWGLDTIQIDYTKSSLFTWRVSKDSSIKGPNPVEIVSPILCGRDGLEKVDRAVNVLYNLGCEVNKSCGLHVHWSIQDYTGKNVLSLLRLYAKFEGVIDYLVSPSRRGNENKYCRSMVKDSDLRWVTELDRTERKRALEIALLFGTRHIEWNTDEETGRPLDRGSRYHKVNLSAYTQYGTAEFRQHQGTVNSNKTINWIVFTQQLVNKAKYVPVSKQVSAKPTLGELLRVLGLVDYQLERSGCTDPLVLGLGEWLKKRYTLFREGVADE